MNVAILIPNSKESTRCPGKNRVLRSYTLRWIEEELKDLTSHYDVSVYEIRDKSVAVDTSRDSDLSYRIHELYVSNVNEMKDLLKITDVKVMADIFVLLQLTQPVRRLGALKEVLKAVEQYPSKLVTSYSEIEFESWRIIRSGNWNEQVRHSKKGNCLNVYDGAWYGWMSRNGSQIVFNREDSKKFVKNIDQVIDVDYPEQLRNRFTVSSKVKHTVAVVTHVFASTEDYCTHRLKVDKKSTEKNRINNQFHTLQSMFSL